MGSGVGMSVTYTTSGVEVCVTVGGTDVKVGTLVAVASFIPSEGRIPQAPARSITSMTKGTIDICLDSFIRENISTSR